MFSAKISVLLASYGAQSRRYLDLCFRSLAAQTFGEFEVIHVSSGEFDPWRPDSKKEHCKSITREIFSEFPSISGIHYHSYERLHFPAAIAKAYERTDPDTEYIMLLNDDVILQEDCINRLLNTVKLGPMIVNPQSNCDDNGRFYLSGSPFTKLQYRIEEMEELYPEVIKYDNLIRPLLFRQPQVHFYCTMMTRKCWEEVGGIDVNLKTGYDDADFCLRAKQKGYEPVIAMHAYALHGSGVSADIHLTQDDRAFNEKYFMAKHK